jgi:hypothetical protein
MQRCEVHGSTDLFDGKFKHGSINGGENCEESRSENILTVDRTMFELSVKEIC